MLNIHQNVVDCPTTEFLLTEMRVEEKFFHVVGVFMICPIFKDQKTHAMHGGVMTYYTYYNIYLLSIF